LEKFKGFSNRILFLTDAPETQGGLARVARDLASLVCMMPEFQVAVLGRGSVGNSKFPWTSYSYPEHGDWKTEAFTPARQDRTVA